jgi:hypothetical protein
VAGLKIGDLRNSAFDADAFPKRYPVLDFGGGGLRLRIKPGGVVVLHTVDRDVIVVRGSLPRTDRGVTAGLQDFFFYGFRREILVTFNHDRGVALRDHFSAPRCFGHFVRLWSNGIVLVQDIAGMLNLSKGLDAQKTEAVQIFVPSGKKAAHRKGRFGGRGVQQAKRPRLLQSRPTMEDNR